MIRLSLFLLLSIAISVACKKKEDENAAKTLSNISYGSSSSQKMDIYLPANRSTTTTKTFVMIHGGGWAAGDKADMVGLIDALKTKFPECAFININYRLASNGTTNVFPAQEEDVNAAIADYLAHATEYKVSNDLIVMGLSAGGHLALMKGYKHNGSGNVKAVIDGFGPTDLIAAWNLGGDFQTLLYGVTGKTYPADSTFFAQSSPINFTSATVPPTLILQGGADEIVPPSQSFALRDKLQTAGAVNELVFYSTEGHGWGGANLLDTYNRIETFVRANVF